MFYYFIPRLKCNGKITLHNKSIDVYGQTWYDHEFDGCIKYNKNSIISSNKLNDCGWYWFSIQLDNKYDITVSHIFDTNDLSTIDKSVLIIGPNNERFEYINEDDIELKSLNNWLSG